jgi:hypothetical protein
MLDGLRVKRFREIVMVKKIKDEYDDANSPNHLVKVMMVVNRSLRYG